MANLLLLAVVFLIFLTSFLIFYNGLWAFLIFILSFVVIAIWSNTPEAKALAEKQEAEAKRAALAAAKATEGLEKNFQQLSKDPTNAKALNYVLDVLEGLNKEKLKPLISSTILPLLKIKPLDERVRAIVLSCAQKSISRSTLSTQVPSKAFYAAALDILQQHPEQTSLKQYALEVGRWHYSIARPDGKVTIYDEQSMQNDILVRSR